MLSCAVMSALWCGVLEPVVSVIGEEGTVIVPARPERNARVSKTWFGQALAYRAPGH